MTKYREFSYQIRKSRFEDIARSGFLDLKKGEIRRSAFLDFLKSGSSGSGRDQEIKPPEKSYGIGIPVWFSDGNSEQKFRNIIRILLEDHKLLEFIKYLDRKNRWIHRFVRWFKHFIQIGHF